MIQLTPDSEDIDENSSDSISENINKTNEEQSSLNNVNQFKNNNKNNNNPSNLLPINFLKVQKREYHSSVRLFDKEKSKLTNHFSFFLDEIKNILNNPHLNVVEKQNKIENS
jgi:hypothetical protein